MAHVETSVPLSVFMRGLTQIAPVAIFHADTQGLVTYVNERWSLLSGLSPEASRGAGWAGALHTGDRDRVLAAWRTAAVARRDHVDRCRLLGADGSTRIVEVRVIPLAPGHGLVGVLEDLTALHGAQAAGAEASRALEVTRRRGEAVFQHALDAIVLADDAGRCLDANPAACELFGLPRAALIGTSVAHVSAPGGEHFHAAWQAFLAAGEAAGEYAVRRADGQQRDVEFRAVAGVLPGTHLSVLRDITERKQGERAQAAALQRLQVLSAIDASILQASSTEEVATLVTTSVRPLLSADTVSLALLDDDGAVVGVWRADGHDTATRVPGCEASGVCERVLAGDLVASATADLEGDGVPGPVVPPFEAYLAVPVRSAERVMGVLFVGWQTRAGALRATHATAREVADRLAVALTSARLTADLRAAEVELRALASRLAESREGERRTIARELHDEIGQLLTALKLSLQGRGGGDAGERRAGAPVRLVDELIVRVRDLTLDLSPPLLHEFGLSAALAALVDRLTGAVDVVVTLECRLPPERPPMAVEAVVYRVVQEGLTNVIRHARARKAHVRCHRVGATLSVEVADDGRGFDPRAVGPHSSGLSGLRARLEPLAGRLHVRSGLTRGTTLTVHVPLRLAGEAP